MTIRFPQSIEEYTDGELWYEGIDESIAHRILFSLNKVGDPYEMRLRKIYLAHYYCEREDYPLAINLCRQLLMEDGIDKEILLLMQYCCAKRGDIIGIGEVFGYVKHMSERDRSSFMENFDTQEISPEMFLGSMRRKNGTKVEYKNGWVEYYKDDKLVYKFFDKDYAAFMHDHTARRMLSEGDPIGAIAQLDKINFSHVRQTTILLCEQTYINAFMDLNEHLNAYAHCKAFVDKKAYIETMLLLMDGLRIDGYTAQYEELRRFIASLKGYDIFQLSDFFDYSCEVGDYEFWDMIEENNPLSDLPESDERLCLQGRDFERKGELELAEKCWRKAKSIYGQFSGAKYYLAYPKMMIEAEEMLDGDTVDITDAFKETFVKKIDDWNDKEELIENADLKACQLNIALCDLCIDIERLSEIVRRVYESGVTALVSEIDRLAVSEEAEDVNRAICLANFMVNCNERKILWQGDMRRNIAKELSCENKEVLYGIAMFAAHAMRVSADAEGWNRIFSDLKKLSEILITQKVARPKAYVIYAFLIDYYADMSLPQKRMPNYLCDLDELRDALVGSVEFPQLKNCSELRDKMLSKLYTIKNRI